MKATIGGVVAGVLLAPVAASAASSVVPAGAQEATYEITSTVVDAGVGWVQQVGPLNAMAVMSSLLAAGRAGLGVAAKSGVALASKIGAAMVAEVSAGVVATTAVTGAAVVAAVGAVGLAVEETRRALKGEKLMQDIAAEHWSKRGFAGTMKELWWQIAN